MSRVKSSLSHGARLADYLSASLLARVYPSPLVSELLDAYECNSVRHRRFPASTVVYYCMSLSLYPDASYEDVFSAVTQGLAWQKGSAYPAGIRKSSICAARSKLPWELFRTLQERACPPLAGLTDCPQAFYRGLRLVAMDGSNLEVADEPENVKEFGYPGSRTGVAGYPQAKCALLVECATHAIVDASIGGYRTAEWTLCEPLLRSLDASMLCLADRGFNGIEQWRAAAATGAQLLWRCSARRRLPVRTPLEDGSYLSRLVRRGDPGSAIPVRVVEYTLPVPDGDPVRYRLLTTMLDAAQAPALELAALYHQRWEIESVFDELKTHLHQRRRVLRSKTPALVKQEFYAWLLAHYAVRWLMFAAAAEHRIPPEKLSFISNVQLLRRTQPHSGDFPPNPPTIA